MHHALSVLLYTRPRHELGRFSSRIYLHCATYLILVNAEFFLVLAFFFFVLSGWGSILSCFCADINTTYSMGTAAFMLPILLLLVLPFYTTARFNAEQNFAVSVGNAADFTAVGAAITLRLGLMLPKFSPLV